MQIILKIFFLRSQSPFISNKTRDPISTFANNTAHNSS